MKKIVIFLLLAFVAYLGYVVHVTQVLEPSLKSDSFKNCEPLLKSRGPEDFEIIEDKFLIVSSGYHKPFYKKGIHPGKLIVFDLENGKEKKYRFEFEFNPHGLHSRKIAPHTYLIAAINHTSKGDRVEFFEFNSQDEGLEYKRSVANEEFYHLNDIVLLGENKFLVTQDRYFDNQVGSLFEAFARLAMGRILYFNEDQLDVVATGLRYPNGITKVNEQFVVASMTDKKLLFYNWEKEKLNLSEEIFVNGFPDNVTYNKQSNKIFVGVHYKALKLKKHSKNPTLPSESYVLELDLESKKQAVVWEDTGANYSATSVAYPWKNKLILGQIYGDQVLLCRDIVR